MIARFGVGPVAVVVRGFGERVVPVVRDVGRYLYAGSTPSAAASELLLDVETGPPRPRAEDLRVTATFDNGFILGREGEAIVLQRGGCYAHLDVQNGRGKVRLADEQQGSTKHWLECALVLESLLILMHGHGWFSVHAAALAYRGRGLVLAASGDSGKSTLALRLVQHGWDYLSDDTVLLDGAAEPVTMRGLRAHFSVDPEAAAFFPGLEAGREASLLKEEKWALNVEALYPDRRVDRGVPHALVFPQITDADASRLEPISHVDAFGRLLAQSSLARVRLDRTEDHLATLGRLVRQAPAYRLHAGRDVLEAPAVVEALLRSLLSATLPTP